MSLARRAASEALGTAILLAAVVGSGIMGERLAGGNVAIALLANSFATGCALVALILAFGPRSGAHFNPVVTLALRLPPRDTVTYIAAQFAGAIVGVLLAHGMFDLPLLQEAVKVRTGSGQWLSEVVATFGLVFLILSLQGKSAWAAPFAVGSYIAAAYWFTASTSFANPAVTIARGFTDTFSGILLADAPAFILCQLLGAALALVIHGSLRIDTASR